MYKLPVLFLLMMTFFACKQGKKLNIENFKTGSFEIPADNKYGKTTFTRKGQYQIETYENRVDTLIIYWKNNFNYTLQMLHPINKIDNETIHVKITGITVDSYDFEAIVGESNYIQKGTVIKISE